ncbi:MAG: elongation factor P [Parcubacteria group bacterium]|nr:elongation factor P [Parcubacteria group bacterium]
MISTSEFEKGMVLKIDNEPWQIMDYEFVHPGKGAAFVRVTIKNLKTNKVLERSFKTGERFDELELEYRKATYLYKDRRNAVFSLRDTKERVSMSLDEVGNEVIYLKENSDIELIYIGGELNGINMPKKVSLKVIEAPPAVKGDTVTGTMKTVTLETGLKLEVPIFIKEGEIVLVNTETGQYGGRA